MEHNEIHSKTFFFQDLELYVSEFYKTSNFIAWNEAISFLKTEYDLFDCIEILGCLFF